MISCDTAALIRSNELLKPYTTFKAGGPAKFFADVRTPHEAEQALAFRRTRNLPLFILGGGSNIIVSDHGFEGLVVHPVNQGVTIVGEDSSTVTLQINAGHPWDDVVAFAVAHGWWGIENLSHIPGQAGAALVQNIGAYGQQISDVLLNTEVIEVGRGTRILFAASDCRLGYRESIFNSSRKGELFIWNIALRLTRYGRPNLDYPDVKRYFGGRGTSDPSLAEIREAIIRVRDSKFPYPREERGGNAGSFFKNLLLTSPEYEELERRFRDHFDLRSRERLRGFKDRFQTSGKIKIPTAFLIEACGLKGYRIGGVKVNETQPLVLLNEGGATASDVLKLARHIRQTIYKLTGLVVPLEPELVGFNSDELAHFLTLE